MAAPGVSERCGFSVFRHSTAAGGGARTDEYTDEHPEGSLPDTVSSGLRSWNDRLGRGVKAMTEKDAAQTAAKPYTPAFLAIYDLWVIKLSDRYAWRCPAEVMLEPYNKLLGARHLEVGPGSGWFLVNAALASDAEITLLDLNPTPMGHTRRRLHGKARQVHTVTASVLEPLPEETSTGGFDSVGINFVMHCLPGDFTEKGVAFTHLAKVLADDGVLFGSTILNQRPATLFGRALTAAYTRVGAFNNAGDDHAGLRSALEPAFEEVELTDIGDVTLFTARRPRR
ncbi:class I SAM-dependent methyltransferase [Nocardia sp. NPDC127526]|uniref:class I SAM-dependent methyltransferase n=1 Tax=Nocardia sp. NPDC127526 TaxID=3345393 RepID=UPI00363A94CC